MSLLALLDEGPRYGLQLKQEFDARTGEIWQLNVGQVYTTLQRLERDGLVESTGAADAQHTYRITPQGREQLAGWFARPTRQAAPPRDETVLKLLMAAARGQEQLRAVIRSERRAAVETLQEYTRLKADPAQPSDLGWLLLLDSFIFKAESRIRWLDAAQARLAQMAGDPGADGGADASPAAAEQAGDQQERVS